MNPLGNRPIISVETIANLRKGTDNNGRNVVCVVLEGWGSVDLNAHKLATYQLGGQQMRHMWVVKIRYLI